MSTSESAQADALPTRSKKFRRLRRVLRGALLIYLTLCVILYLGQDWMVFPGRSSQGTPTAQVRPRGNAELVSLTTAAGDPIVALFGKAISPDGSAFDETIPRPTILYFYGNAGAIAWSEGEFDHFRRLGCNVLIPDFPGYGMSGGKASETSFYATADACWDYLQHRQGIDGTRIITVGWSLGAAVAVDLASRKPVAGLATFNGFTSMPEMAGLVMPWFPTSLLLKYRFDNLTKIAAVNCPMLICNGRLDTLVPPMMSDRLAKAAKGPVSRVTIESANHDTIFVAQPDDVFGAMDRLITEVVKPAHRE